MKKHIIEIAVDTTEAEQFCNWLKEHGHDASVGKSTGNYVDGELTSSNEYADNIFRGLWESYCNQ